MLIDLDNARKRRNQNHHGHLCDSADPQHGGEPGVELRNTHAVHNHHAAQPTVIQRHPGAVNKNLPERGGGKSGVQKPKKNPPLFPPGGGGGGEVFIFFNFFLTFVPPIFLFFPL